MSKRMTLEKLAIMVQAGFAEAYDRLASKKDVKQLLDKMRLDFDKKYATKEDLQKEIRNLRLEIKEDIYDLEDRLTGKWGNRIDRLEEDMKTVKGKLKLT